MTGKIVTIVGLAKSGQAAARLAHESHAVVRVTECAQENQIDASFRTWVHSAGITAEFGTHTEGMIRGSDLVVISPGVRLDAEVVLWARREHIPVIGELEFACRFCPCPMIAVTGSNGKTTVTTLIGRVLQEMGREVFVGGNIGNPFSAFVLDLMADHIAVLEVSSFQLETIQTFRPHIAVFLNISQNHLDRHADMEEYFHFKRQVFRNQVCGDFAILNAQDSMVSSLSGRLPSKIEWFNTDEQKRNRGYDNPNFLAVDAVASVFGIHPDFCQKVFKEFQGIEHRLEHVREIDGVAFVNDSKCTTVEAGRWALSRIKSPVIWICGGRDKNLDFSKLRGLVQRNVKKIVVIGEAAAKIENSFADIADVEHAVNMQKAVKQALVSGQAGDTVLLSPICASFDMFRNFEHRGEEFKRIVRSL